MINDSVKLNYTKISWRILVLPLFLISSIVLFLISQGVTNAINYIAYQQDCFFAINQFLAKYPTLQINLTQLGDVSIFLSFLALLLLYIPKIWENFFWALLVSLVFSTVLKNIFAVPRPSMALNHDNFTIVGKMASGHASFPSGHSISAFTIVTVVLVGLMPKLIKNKLLFSLFALSLATLVALSRIGVGAHYPLDVLFGSLLGILSGLLGIIINNKYPVWQWVGNRKYYPIFIIAFIVCAVTIIGKILEQNLAIYYLAVASLFFSLYNLIRVYIKKEH